MEGQKRATSAIDRKTLERADTIAINNQVEYNLRIRKKRKRKNKCTLSNHPAPFFSMVGHLNTENCTNMMFMEEATQKNDYQESVCCI